MAIEQDSGARAEFLFLLARTEPAAYGSAFPSTPNGIPYESDKKGGEMAPNPNPEARLTPEEAEASARQAVSTALSACLASELKLENLRLQLLVSDLLLKNQQLRAELAMGECGASAPLV